MINPKPQEIKGFVAVVDGEIWSDTFKATAVDAAVLAFGMQCENDGYLNVVSATKSGITLTLDNMETKK